jgi:hypothetical protein
VGDIYNASGYESSDGKGLAPSVLDISLSGSTTLTGAISSTDAIHVTKDGSDAVKAAAAGEKASADWVKYQNTSFDISHYYDIGQVANKVNYNGNNDINVTITGDAAWTVTADGIVTNLTANSAAITADKPVTITVEGTLTLDGQVITETTTVGNVTYSLNVDTADYTAQYTDLASGKWYDSEINFILANGYMNGTSTTTFSPNASLTREQLVAILWRIAGSPDAGELTFDDADQVSSYAKTAVAWATEKGYVNGVGNNKFAPKSAITRQDMAKIVYLWAEGSADSSADLSKFTDAAQVSSYAVEPLTWAVANGLFQGDNNNQLAPRNNITRIQAAAVLARQLNK